MEASEFREKLDLYLLDALDPEVKAMVEEYAASHADAEAELADARKMLAALDRTLSRPAAPEGLAQRVAAAIRESEHDRNKLRLRFPIPWKFAAAAVVLLALGLALWLAVGRPYPMPVASGPFEVVGGRLDRGATIRSKGDGASLVLGGYCRVEMASGTSVKIEGADRREAIVLENGQVTCEVNRGVGSFQVKTDVGTVSVQGTKFSVRIEDCVDPQTPSQGDIPMLMTRRMAVVVVTGAVLVSGPWGDTPLAAGQGQVFLAAAAGAAQPANADKPWKIKLAPNNIFDRMIETLELLNMDSDVSFNLDKDQKQKIQDARDGWKKVYGEFKNGEPMKTLNKNYQEAQQAMLRHQGSKEAASAALKKLRGHLAAEPQADPYMDKIKAALTPAQLKVLRNAMEKIENAWDARQEAHHKAMKEAQDKAGKGNGGL